MLSRARAGAVVESDLFQRTVLCVILVNAVALGLETSPSVVARYGTLLDLVEALVVTAFSCEVLLRLYARGRAFFRDPWNWFDLVVVSTAIIPATNVFSVLRMLRILGLARLVSVVSSLRRVVSAMLAAIPGIGSTIAMLVVALYSGALLGTQLFRDAAPEYFGDLEHSLFTMFEIMTVENWPSVAGPIMEKHPTAWLFFVAYIVLTAFILLNLLIGVIVSAMEIELNRDRWQADQELERIQHEAVMAELQHLRAAVTRLEERAAHQDAGV
ncbi:ion transporter [Actinopolymorpha alba]|uniref:ion transporter n=1 Tax=Actinopolymorpha alba TaxID=533267 RepID=UPI00037C17BB|nr:ion transporter [Actinopolymorpha alba]